MPDGSLGIVGRQDDQVKIRGNRVELPEVENVIREIDYVDDETVQTIKNDDNNEIVSYVVLNKEFDENELKDSICSYVAERKPNYMVPSFVIILDAIPLTVNGKVDRRALTEVDTSILHEEFVEQCTDADDYLKQMYSYVKRFHDEQDGDAIREGINKYLDK